MTRYLSVTEYARKHGRPRATVKRWVERGQLPAVRIGRQWNIPAEVAPPTPARGRPRKAVAE
jgi:excisionase family DNA binding protein